MSVNSIPKVQPGARFGKLTILNMPRRSKTGKYVCKVICDCGKVKECPSQKIKYGRVKSCGCSRYDKMRKHGLSNTTEYSIYIGMKCRCENPKNTAYHRYGGRGITVCSRWSSSFANFIADMGKRPTNKHTLERIDNTKGYGPDNCRWATMKEQSNNTSRNFVVEIGGNKYSLSQAAEKYGIDNGTLRSRLLAGWSAEKAVSCRANCIRYMPQGISAEELAVLRLEIKRAKDRYRHWKNKSPNSEMAAKAKNELDALIEKRNKHVGSAALGIQPKKEG